MIKPIIIVEEPNENSSEVFSNSIKKVKTGAINAGFNVVRASYSLSEQSVDLGNHEYHGATVYGSIRFTNALNNYYFYGGKTDFSYFSKDLKREHLLNSNYVMSTFGDLKTNFSFWENMFGSRMFIRPVSSKKTFAGQVIKDLYDLETLECISSVSDATHIVIAEEKHIAVEERHFIYNGKSVAATCYPEAGVPVLFDFAEYISEMYSPDCLFTIDVCELEDGTPKLVEYNSFSNAGFYFADENAIMKTLHEQVLSDYGIS